MTSSSSSNGDVRNDNKGSAIVFWHEVEASPPASLVRALPVHDIKPVDPKEKLSEKTVCRAKFRHGTYPCIVLWLQEDATAEELTIRNLLDPVREKEFEDKGRRWAAEKIPKKVQENVSSGSSQSGALGSGERRGTNAGDGAARIRPIPVTTANERVRDASQLQNNASHHQNVSRAGRHADPDFRHAARRPRSESPELNISTKRVPLASSPSATPRSILKQRMTPLPSASRQSSVSPSRSCASGFRGAASRGRGARSRSRARARTPNKSSGVPIGPNLFHVKPPPLTAFPNHFRGCDIPAVQAKLLKLDSKERPFHVAIKELFSLEELATHVPAPRGAHITKLPLLDQDRLSCALSLISDYCEKHHLPEPDGSDLNREWILLRHQSQRKTALYGSRMDSPEYTDE